MTTLQFQTDAKALIDDLKAVCANAGLGNDGNEFKIITQIFLYKFLNDKFAYEAKRSDLNLRGYDRDEILKVRGRSVHSEPAKPVTADGS